MDEKKSYIYGRNAVIEALRSDANIEKIYVSYSAKGAAPAKIYSLAKKSKINVTKFDDRKFSGLERRVCPRGSSAQGVVALVSPIEYIGIERLIKIAFEKEEKPILVALDGVEDPHNLGAIARSVECSGAAGLILPARNSAPVTPASIKTSAGALENVPVAKVSNLNVALEKLKKAGFWSFGADIKADKLYTDKIYDSPAVLIMGSEGSGMRKSTLQNCDFLVKIPILGKVDSLNVSVSAGIILFEMRRQRSGF